jgi:hypothetical protein
MGVLLEVVSELSMQGMKIHEEDQMKMQLIQDDAQMFHEEYQVKM